MQNAHAHQKSGFTLFEMSIVIGIIALLIGGSLVGRDLIHAAMIRQTIQQYEQFNTAAQAFRLKYECLPGDCINVTEFGFDPTSAGNGDGLIGDCVTLFVTERCNGNNVGNFVYMEVLQFWYHLSAAGLIKEVIPVSPYPPPSLFSTFIGLGQQTPGTKIYAMGTPPGLKGGWGIMGDIVFDAALGGDKIHTHGFILSPLQIVNTGAGGLAGSVDTPGGYFGYDLYAIDTKLDDGLPLSGSVRGYHGVSNASDGVSSGKRLTLKFSINATLQQHCIDTTVTPGIYNTQYQGEDLAGLCSLVILGGF